MGTYTHKQVLDIAMLFYRLGERKDFKDLTPAEMREYAGAHIKSYIDSELKRLTSGITLMSYSESERRSEFSVPFLRKHEE